VPSSECTIATDRLYSEDYIWVKSVSTNLVVIGVTPTLITISSRPYALSLEKINTELICGNRFGDMEGQKVNSDLISPVSGKIVQVNEVVVRQGMGQGEYMPTVNSDPWNTGWMIVVQLKNEEELKVLMKPQEFLTYLGH
jgi:glycine cleavage system H protein